MSDLVDDLKRITWGGPGAHVESWEEHDAIINRAIAALAPPAVEPVSDAKFDLAALMGQFAADCFDAGKGDAPRDVVALMRLPTAEALRAYVRSLQASAGAKVKYNAFISPEGLICTHELGSDSVQIFFDLPEDLSRLIDILSALRVAAKAPNQQLTGECPYPPNSFEYGYFQQGVKFAEASRLVPVSADAGSEQAVLRDLRLKLQGTLSHEEDTALFNAIMRLGSLYTSPQVPATVPEGCVVLQIADVRAIMQAAVDDTCITVKDFVEARKRIDYELHHAQSTESMSSEGGGNV